MVSTRPARLRKLSSNWALNSGLTKMRLATAITVVLLARRPPGRPASGRFGRRDLTSDQPDRVSVQLRIGGDDREVFCDGLGDQKAVEGIAVVGRQVLDRHGVL